MKKSILAVLVVILAIFGGIMTVMSLAPVGQGEVGVVWTMKDGVQKETLSPGIHFISPTAKMKKYPVSQQQLVFSNNPGDYNEKEHADWHVDAPANGGMVKLNMTVNYSFLPDKIVGLYSKFNGMDGDAIVESMVQNSIVAYIKEVTPQFTVMDIYSDKRAEVSQAITKYLDTKLSEEYGISVASALIIDVQLDETLQAKIQAKEQAKGRRSPGCRAAECSQGVFRKRRIDHRIPGEKDSTELGSVIPAGTQDVLEREFKV